MSQLLGPVSWSRPKVAPMLGGSQLLPDSTTEATSHSSHVRLSLTQIGLPALEARRLCSSLFESFACLSIHGEFKERHGGTLWSLERHASIIAVNWFLRLVIQYWSQFNSCTEISNTCSSPVWKGVNLVSKGMVWDSNHSSIIIPLFMMGVHQSYYLWTTLLYQLNNWLVVSNTFYIPQCFCWLMD